LYHRRCNTHQKRNSCDDFDQSKRNIKNFRRKFKKKYMKKNSHLLFVSGLVLGTGIFYQFTDSSSQTVAKENHIYIPSNIHFCGEKVPIEIVDVKERLDREFLVNINLHSSTSLIIKRANKYFPIIEPILKKNGIPDDFKYLCVIESALANATSS